LLKFLEGKNLVQGKYLVAGSNAPKHNFIAFYNPKAHQIELELKGKSIDDLANAGTEFFKIVDNLYRKFY